MKKKTKWEIKKGEEKKKKLKSDLEVNSEKLKNIIEKKINCK